MSNKSNLIEVACDEVLRVLVEYMDGDLAFEVRSGIEHHLSNCEHCTAIYDGVRNVVELMGSHGMIELPQGFSQRLRARLMFHTR